MIILTDRKLSAQEFIQYTTGQYFFKCFTLREINQCYWQECGIPISKYWKLTEINKIPKDAYVALVECSKEDDYMNYEVYFVRVHKKYIKRFKKNMLEDEI